MNWFKNLNATPRLMSSFGVLLVLTLGISYLAINNLSKANDRIAQVKAIGETLPGYERGVEEVAQAIGANDTALASTRLQAIAEVAAQMSKAINQACELNEANAEEVYQANQQAYQTSRSLVIGVVASAIFAGNHSEHRDCARILGASGACRGRAGESCRRRP
jgi:hypothetical protein